MADRVVWLVANGWVRPGGGARGDLHPQGGRGAGHPDPGQAGGPAAHRRRRHRNKRVPRRAAQHRRARAQGLHLPLLRERHRLRLRAAARRGTGRGAARRRPVLPARQRGGGSLRRRLRAFPGRQVHPRQGRHPARRGVRGAPAGPGRGRAAGCWTGSPSSRRCRTSPAAKKNAQPGRGGPQRPCCAPGRASRTWWAATPRPSGPGAHWTSATSWPSRPGWPTRSRWPRRLERQRYKVVLLDEFQDTSHAQLVLFSRLFGDGHAVTAVGDPNQSIYGFRGASAGPALPLCPRIPGPCRRATPDSAGATGRRQRRRRPRSPWRRRRT